MIATAHGLMRSPSPMICEELGYVPCREAQHLAPATPNPRSSTRTPPLQQPHSQPSIPPIPSPSSIPLPPPTLRGGAVDPVVFSNIPLSGVGEGAIVFIYVRVDSLPDPQSKMKETNLPQDLGGRGRGEGMPDVYKISMSAEEGLGDREVDGRMCRWEVGGGEQGFVDEVV